METDSLEKFEETCRRVHAEMPPGTHWEWDEDFNMALAVVEDMNSITGIISKNFEYRWEYDSDADGPQNRIYERALSLFGIVPGQIIYSSEAMGGLVLFAVCWPWGKRKNASLRIGIFSWKQPSSAMSDVNASLAEWFGLEGEEDDDSGWSDFTV